MLIMIIESFNDGILKWKHGIILNGRMILCLLAALSARPGRRISSMQKCEGQYAHRAGESSRARRQA